MNRVGALMMALVLCLTAAGCAGQPQADTTNIGNNPEAVLNEEITGEINVSCYDSMMYQAFLEEAAKLFEEIYPGTTVNVTSFSQMPEIKTMEQDGMTIAVVETEDDTQAKEDYISKVSTELMSGEGADVLAMDILPFYRLADSGQLVDLSGYMDADEAFITGDYRENVLDAARYKGGQYFMPLDYSFGYVAYDSSLLSQQEAQALEQAQALSLETLMALGQDAYQKANTGDASVPMFGMSRDTMFHRLLNETYESLVDVENRWANFTDGKFEALLEQARTMSQEGYLIEEMDFNMEDPMSFLEGRNSDQRYLYKYNLSSSLINLFTPDDFSLSFTSGYDTGNEEDDKLAVVHANANGEVPFSYSQAYGINSNSGNKPTAWEFIKFLLSQEMQLSTNLISVGHPINNAARTEKNRLMFTGAFYGESPLEMNQETLDALEAYNQVLESLSNSINTMTLYDETIDSMITAEAEQFFAGSKSAREVAESLQSKAELYLNE